MFKLLSIFASDLCLYNSLSNQECSYTVYKKNKFNKNPWNHIRRKVLTSAQWSIIESKTNLASDTSPQLSPSLFLSYACAQFQSTCLSSPEV